MISWEQRGGWRLTSGSRSEGIVATGTVDGEEIGMSVDFPDTNVPSATAPSDVGAGV